MTSRDVYNADKDIRTRTDKYSGREIPNQVMIQADEPFEGWENPYIMEASRLRSQCITICIAMIIGAIAIGTIIALAVGSDKPWVVDPMSANIIPKEGNDVVVTPKRNLILHENLMLGNKTALSKGQIGHTSAMGDAIVFGDGNGTHNIIQSKVSTTIKVSGTTSGVLDEQDMVFQITNTSAKLAIPHFFAMSGSYIASDSRIKTEIQDISDSECISNVMRLRPRKYNYNSNWIQSTSRKNITKIRGFIAQEVEKVLPNSVSQTNIRLGNRMIDDFKNIRKEDLITETVGSIRYLMRKTMEFYIFDVCVRSDPFGNSLLQIPPLAENLCGCLNLLADNVTNCICTEFNSMCLLNKLITICDKRNPLIESCDLIK